MANYVFNIAKGRVGEYFNRVKANDPAPSAIIVIPLSATDTEANRQDDADVATFLAAAPNEITTNNWVRKTLTDTQLGAVGPDNVNNRFPATIPSFTFTGPTAGGNTVGLLFAYDADTAAGTDSNLIPLVHCDFVVTADGNDVVVNTGDIFRAS